MNNTKIHSIPKRREVRVGMQTGAKIYPPQSGVLQAQVTNISLRGICLQGLDKQNDLEGKVHLEFVLPGPVEAPIMAIAKVLWHGKKSSKNLLGLEIVKYFPAGRSLIQSFLAHQRLDRFNYNYFDAQELTV